MKAGWEVKPLGEVCDFQNGFAFKSKSFRDVGVPVIRITNIQDERVSENKIVYVNEAEYDQDLSRYSVNQGDLLIAMSGGTTGKIGFSESPTRYLLNQRVGKFLPMERLDIRYLFYFLSTKVEESLEISAGSAQPNLSTKQIKDFNIPLPPLEEQRRIVALLDQAFEGLDRARANTEANLEEASTIFSSVLGGVFQQSKAGWAIGTVEEAISQGVLAKPIDGNHGETHPKKSDFVDSGVPFIMASDLEDGSVNQTDCYFISEEQANSLRKGFAKSDDILLSHKGTIGRVAKLKTDLKFVMLTPQVTYYRSDNHSLLEPEYIYYFLQSTIFQKPLLEISGGGSTRAYIGITKQRTLPFYYPGVEKQNELIGVCRNIENSAKKLLGFYNRKLDELANLRQSLLAKAFAGELT